MRGRVRVCLCVGVCVCVHAHAPEGEWSPADDLRRVFRNSSRPTRPLGSANLARSRTGKVRAGVSVRVGGGAVRHAFSFFIFLDVHAMCAMHALMNRHRHLCGVRRAGGAYTDNERACCVCVCVCVFV
jgi:hypothetical protein